MNFMTSMVLNAHVANETIKRVNGSSSSYDNNVTQEEQREIDRFEMKWLFCFGVMLGIWYLLSTAGKDSFIDFFYILAYLICQLAVGGFHWDSKQPVKAIKTSLILSSVLAIVMLVPFTLDADDAVSFVMLSILSLAEILFPLYELYKMKEK